jgi:CubicO group peptidase (beta-lactamase class C family)
MKHNLSMLSILAAVLGAVTTFAGDGAAPAATSFTQQLHAVNGSIITFDAMDAFLAAQMESYHLPGLSIAFINDGKIVYHKALGYADVETHRKVDEATVFEAASMSKPVFAFFVMKLVERGVLTLDTPLYQYLPNPDLEYDERYKLITARMVLRHTTGLPNWAQYQPPDPSLHLNIKPGGLYLRFTPGTGFSYSGEAFEYLVRVVTHLLHSGPKELGAIVYRGVCGPLGMTHADFSWNAYVKTHRATGYKQVNDDGVNRPQAIKTFEDFSAPGGLRSSAVDYARFLTGIIDEKGLNQASFAEMLKPTAKPSSGKTNDDNDDHWGLGIAVKKTPYGWCYMHSGNNGDFTGNFVLFKERKCGFVFLTNCNRGGDLNDKLEPYFTEGVVPR